MVVGGFQCPDACAHDFAYVLVFHFLKVLHIEDLSLLGWQALHCMLELYLCLVSIEVGVALQSYLDTVRFRMLCTGEAYGDVLAPLQEIYRFVVGYSIEPCGKACISSEIVQSLPCLEKYILQDVIRVIVVQHHPAYLPIQLFLKLPYQSFKGLLSSGGVV